MKLFLKQLIVINFELKFEVEEFLVLQIQSFAEEVEKIVDGEKKEDGKKGIEIRIVNKIGIIGKVLVKKNVFFFFWISVSR